MFQRLFLRVADYAWAGLASGVLSMMVCQAGNAAGPTPSIKHYKIYKINTQSIQSCANRPQPVFMQYIYIYLQWFLNEEMKPTRMSRMNFVPWRARTSPRWANPPLELYIVSASPWPYVHPWLVKSIRVKKYANVRCQNPQTIRLSSMCKVSEFVNELFEINHAISGVDFQGFWQASKYTGMSVM